MKKQILVSVLLLASAIAKAQTEPPTKKQIRKFLTQGKHVELTACNSSQAFFKSDTISFYTNINYFYQSAECCEFIQWEVYKRNKAVQTEMQICEEPSTAKVWTEGDYFGIKIPGQDGKFFLEKKSNEKKNERFEVLEINEVQLPKEKNKVQRLTLVRVI
jgi:phosphoribosylformylglycinamidine (FGAM) synthase-like amidotransferase family enzyme